MEEILLKIILTALCGWLFWTPSVDLSPKEEQRLEQGERTQEKNQFEKEEPVSASRSRSVFSAYIVGGLDCMDDGSYDEYVRSRTIHRDSGEIPEEPGDDTDGFPKIYLDFMGLDLTNYISGGSCHFHKAFCSDKFYMEYPVDWYVGSTDGCPLTFVPEWEYEASGELLRDWADYIDEKLEGRIDEVQTYIEGGGINGYLEEVIGKSLTEEYEIVLRERDSDWLLIYDLKKGGAEAAEIIVWCNQGKCSIRNWEMGVTVDPREDYGRIMVFHEWKSIDFSSREAIQEYVESADFLCRLLGAALEEEVEEEVIAFQTTKFTTFYHEFVCVEIRISDEEETERILHQAAVYIPVTRPDQENWVVVFETFPGSRQEENVYYSQIKERVMSTFVVLPYYHRVEKGESLSSIAGYYGEDPDLAYGIADWNTDRIRHPDLICTGQEIEIPLGVLFRKTHY